MAMCKQIEVLYVLIFIGSNVIYAGGIDKGLEKATLSTSAGKTLNQQSLQVR
jgi:hypothetical protein